MVRPTLTNKHGRPQKLFQGGQGRHFAHPFQVSHDATQTDVHKTLYPCYITKKMLSVTATVANSAPSKTGVPKLGYRHPQWYILLSEGVHLRLAIEGENMFIQYSLQIIYTYEVV